MAPSKAFTAAYFCLAVSTLCPVIQAYPYTDTQAAYVTVDPSPHYGVYPGKAVYINYADDDDLPPGYSYPKATVDADDDIPTYPTPGTGMYVNPVPYLQAYPKGSQPADFDLPPGYVMPTVDGMPAPATKPAAAVPAKPAPAAAPKPSPAKPSPPSPAVAPPPGPKAPAAPLPGPCNVEMNFTVCSTVGRTETYYNLKKKYEAPGHLPKLNIIAKKHERGGYFVGEAGCNCRTEFKMVASKEVTGEDHVYYYTNLKSFFEEHVTIDNTFPCMHYGDPVYSGSGCPAPGPGTAKALPPPPTPTTAPACTATLSVTVCVTDKAAFMAELKREEKALAQSVNLKKKAFHEDLTFTDVASARICPTDAKAAIKVDISIPAASSAESDALLQAVQAIGSLIVGQKLPSVVGGAEIGEAATVCS